MKRSSPLQRLRRHGWVLKREGRGHSLWTNPATGLVEAVPRHTEITNVLDGLGIPEVDSDDHAG